MENIQQKYNLSLNAQDGDTLFRILDSSDNILHEKKENFNVDLPRGLYTVQWFTNGISQEKVIKHTKDEHIFFESPKRYSSALFQGYSSSHEYYSNPAASVSKSTTFTVESVSKDDESSIFIFLRYPTVEVYKKLKPSGEIASGFRLLDKEFKLLCVLEGNVVQQDKEWGWAALSVKLKEGLYYLHYHKGKTDRLIPLHLFHNWQTQLFLILHKQPVFQSMRILMANLQTGFDSFDEANKELDKALLRLQNREYKISEQVTESLAYGKWNNPLLGIIWCYIYLRDGAENDERLFNTILGNLSGRILGSKSAPDLQAIRLMKATRDGNVLQFDPFIHPPMFRIGLRSVIRASYDRPDLIPELSPFARFASRVFNDTEWATFDASNLLQAPVSQLPSPATKKNWLIKKLERILPPGAAELLLWFVGRPKSIGVLKETYRTLLNIIGFFNPAILTQESGNDLSDDYDVMLDKIAGLLMEIKSWGIASMIIAINLRLQRGESVSKISINSVAKEIGLPPANLRTWAAIIIAIDHVYPKMLERVWKFNEQLNPQMIQVLHNFAEGTYHLIVSIHCPYCGALSNTAKSVRGSTAGLIQVFCPNGHTFYPNDLPADITSTHSPV